MFSNSGSSGLRHEPRLIAHHWGSSAHHSDLQVLRIGDQAHPRSLIKSLSPPQKSAGKPKRTNSRKLFAQAHRVAATETFLTLIRPHPESPEKQAQRAVQKAVGGVCAGAKAGCLGVSREFEIQIEHNREKGTSLSQIILNFDGDSGLSSIKEGECERWESKTESESLLRMISA